jgi:predicted GNAT family N-acyltransferase
MALSILPFDSGKHDRDNFNCGNARLDRYLQQQARQDRKKNIATVFVLIEPPNPQILGYYTLSAYTIELTEVTPTLAKKLPRYPMLPATLLGRLAIDRQQQGKGYGELLLVSALKKAYAASTQIASVAMIVEAIDEPACKFYAKYGFQAFQTDPMKLYLPMQSIASL